MTTATEISEADILNDVVRPHEPTFNSEAARAILDLGFSERAVRKMRKLLDRNNKGKLTVAESDELEKFRRVGILIDLLQAKARLSLKDVGGS